MVKLMVLTPFLFISPIATFVMVPTITIRPQLQLHSINESASSSSSSSSLDDHSLSMVSLWTDAVNKAVIQLERKTESLQNELKKAESVEATTARAQLITNNLYLFNGANSNQQRFEVPDWDKDGELVELVLDRKYDTAAEEADALFAQARKIKRGSAVVQEILVETGSALEVLRDAQMDFSAVKSDEDDLFILLQDRLIRSASQTMFQIPDDPLILDKSTSQVTRSSSVRTSKPTLGTPASNVRKLRSPHSACIILVGRNRRGNEYLSFQVARGQDVWMHARGCPGAHVILQQRSGQIATDGCFQLAANLAAFYSDARSEAKVEVMAAEPKHIQKPAKSPLGTVKIRQELPVLIGYPDQVPEEYKEAREASGQANNYRRTDKAKLKKRNRDNIQKEREKRKRRLKQRDK